MPALERGFVEALAEQNDANERMRRAAPDMFKALADLGEYARPDNWDDPEFEEDGSADCWRALDAALLKATQS